MRNVDDWLREMRAPPAPVQAPLWPHPRKWPYLAALAAGMLLAVGFGLVGLEQGPGLRGADVALVPQLDLRLVVDRGGVAVRVPAEGACGVGERVFFRLAATAQASATVWVEGPAGREVVGTLEVGPQPRDLADETGLVAYQFDGPGRYLFRASVEGPGVCHACPQLAVVAR